MQPVNNHRNIPLQHSRVLDENGYLLLGEDDEIDSNQKRKRRILHADEFREVHAFPSLEYPGLTVMQHFLLAS